MKGANLCQLAVVEKGEIPGREVRDRVPCRIHYNQINTEEAIPHDRMGCAQGRQGLLRNGLISQRRDLPDCPASPQNEHPCDKSRALRVELIHHGSTGRKLAENSIAGVSVAMRDRVELVVR